MSVAKIRLLAGAALTLAAGVAIAQTSAPSVSTPPAVSKLDGKAESKLGVKSDPKAEYQAFRRFFTEKFPNTPLADFVNGPYSMNEDMRKQWEDKEQFPHMTSRLKRAASCSKRRLRTASRLPIVSRKKALG